MWGLQSVKLLKLDSLELWLMSTKSSGFAGHKQIVELVEPFSDGLDEARKNVEIEIVNLLRRLGADALIGEVSGCVGGYTLLCRSSAVAG
ncbi:hypothetical protein AXG93_1913s2020 [Marchantia polymorpha subsp. ruderalis]|uniref:Uncharacterized protein n=1 Tax=Marchantia polymorpha subsp. ruderalis TaxID=1480154 RepID=A0A176WIQ2_MARPO|nr:hypothetical protein AXG93_1913s2020 [Marchantia polymorpha subsp. ruderalis]